MAVSCSSSAGGPRKAKSTISTLPPPFQQTLKNGGTFTWLQHPRPLSHIGNIWKRDIKLTFVFAEPSLVSGPADALVPTLPLVCWRALTLLALVTTENNIVMMIYKQIHKQATGICDHRTEWMKPNKHTSKQTALRNRAPTISPPYPSSQLQ